MNYLLCNGCSFLTTRTPGDVRTHTGMHLANRFGLEKVRLSAGGRGNDRVVATTKLYFYNNPERAKDTFVLIGWSASSRFDYVSRKSLEDDLLWRTWKLGGENLKWYLKHKFIDVNMNLKIRHLTNILALQDFFKLNNIKYCMYDSLSNNYNIDVRDGLKIKDIETLRSMVDREHFFNFEKMSHHEFCLRNKLFISKDDEHPTAEGHVRWGNLVIEHIRKNNLI